MPPLPLSPTGRALLDMLDHRAYENWLVGQTSTLLDGVFRRMAHQLRTNYRDLSPTKVYRLDAFLQELGTALRGRYAEISTVTQAELASYAAVRGEIAVNVAAREGARRGMTGPLFGGFTDQMARSIASEPFLGLSLDGAEGWFARSAANLTHGGRMILHDGLLLGEGPRELARRLYTVQGIPGIPELRQQARRSLEAFTRTAANAVHGEAQFQSYNQMGSEYSKRYVWISTLDGRTSQICIALANTAYAYADTSAPRPPAHLNCRSLIWPVMTWDDDGGKTIKSNGLPDMERWLRGQPESVQNSMLGATPASLWRGKQITLRDLADSKGRSLTVGQIRVRAGLPPGRSGLAGG